MVGMLNSATFCKKYVFTANKNCSIKIFLKAAMLFCS